MRRTDHWVKGAALFGLIHAAFSLYWAVGGRWLVDTVGAWAVEWGRENPTSAFWFLSAIALFKGAAAVIPLLNAQRRMPWARLWRTISWLGGPFLMLYGGLNALTAAAVLLGLVQPSGPIDRMGTIGHALLWDPLFFVWGLALTLHLWRTRQRPKP